MKQLTIDLGDRSYDILIASKLINQAGPELAQRFGSVKAGIITDSHVSDIYLGPLTESLQKAGIQTQPFIVEAGEESKSLPVFSNLVEQVLAARLERNDLIIALGGGVVGDLAGFVAASVRRGMDFVQIPTSLLAQVDSAVGGKTGINSRHGKNLIGAFYQPKIVLSDIDTLNTLPERELRAGYAEIIKYGLINDKAFFEWLEKNHNAILKKAHIPSRIHAITTSCRAKAMIVSQDEQEHGRRALLNLGHTFGHALEAATHYGLSLKHGEAVAVGLVLAYEFSTEMGFCPPADAQRVAEHLKTVGLRASINDLRDPRITPDKLLDFMAQDKKVTRNAFNLVLSGGIGRAFLVKDVPPDKVRDFLKTKITYFNPPSSD